jgi:hypothetical protein
MIASELDIKTLATDTNGGIASIGLVKICKRRINMFPHILKGKVP